MALHKKKKDDAVSKKISKLKKEGKGTKQAVAQAIAMKGKKKKPAKKKGAKPNFFERFIKEDE